MMWNIPSGVRGTQYGVPNTCSSLTYSPLTYSPLTYSPLTYSPLTYSPLTTPGLLPLACRSAMLREAVYNGPLNR